jgi:hypothetical protein
VPKAFLVSSKSCRASPVLGDVALYRNGLTALRFDVGDNSVRTLLLEE